MGTCVGRESSRPVTMKDVIGGAGPLSALARSIANSDADIEEKRKNVIKEVEALNGADVDGASLLDVQKGVFYLLQSGAYRCHRIAYACNYHTHKREHKYPYLLSNYVKFVKAVLHLYTELQVLDGADHPVIDELITALEEQETQVRERVQTWTADCKEEQEYQMAEERLDALAFKGKTDDTPFDRTVTPTAVKKSDKPTWVQRKQAEQPQRPIHSREAASFLEGFDEVLHEGDARLYLERNNHILLDFDADWEANEKRPGAIMPVKFWYEVFMPKLLAICSLEVEGYDDEQDEAALDAWFQAECDSRRIGKFCTDVIEGWPALDREIKLSIKRAWRLTMHYFLGPEKQRERSSESGVDHRQTGDLTQYVAFLDVYLNKKYVEEAGMRLTFPYFVGPATWCWHHLIAERANQLAPAPQIIDGFKEYFEWFVTFYPCPYCRCHLNDYVAPNVERDLYPVEFLFVGWTPDKDNLPSRTQDGNWTPTTTPLTRLEYITNERTLRLFVWKLHNAVNSSIERSEEWFHSFHSLNTARYWPNMQSTILRGEFGSGVVSAERLSKMRALLECAINLGALRKDILDVCPNDVESMLQHVQPLLEALDKSIEESGFLQEAYSFRKGLIDALPNPDANFDADLVRSSSFSIN